jgi:hypothetical protein
MTDALRWRPMALSLCRVRRVLAVLLTAWVLVQTVGVMHRVAHAQQSAGGFVHAASDATGVLAAIWGEHSNSAECQLFDQSCPDLWHVPALAVLPVHSVTPWVAAEQREHFARIAYFYAARGPPV